MKIFNKLVFIILLLTLTGCDKKQLISERYTYNSESENVFSYYKCDNKKICTRYLYIGDVGESEASYEYEIIKKQQDNTYLVSFNNLRDPNDNYVLIDDAKEDTIIDTDLDISYISNSFIGDKEKYNNIYNEVKNSDTPLSLNYINGLNYTLLEYDEKNDKILVRKTKIINSNEYFCIYLRLDSKKGFESNEFEFYHTTVLNFDTMELDDTNYARGTFKISDSFEKGNIDIGLANISFEYNGFGNEETKNINNILNNLFDETEENLDRFFSTDWYELGFYKYKNN